jgi:lipoprotein-releasing system ATP-binding protein
MPDLTIENLSKQYPTRGQLLIVLRGVSLGLSARQNVAIVGPSGCGKSTLLHVVGTLDQPTSGSVSLRGQDPFQLAEAELARFRNRNIGFVFQDHHLLPQLSVLENVLVPTLADGRPSAGVVDRAKELLDRVGLAQRLQHRPAELSGGERGRVAVARALIQRPQLLLADEPTGNLDHASAMAIAKLLIDLQQQEDAMLIVVTHSREIADLLQCQLTLTEGQLVAHHPNP